MYNQLGSAVGTTSVPLRKGVLRGPPPRRFNCRSERLLLRVAEAATALIARLHPDRGCGRVVEHVHGAIVAACEDSSLVADGSRGALSESMRVDRSKGPGVTQPDQAIICRGQHHLALDGD